MKTALILLCAIALGMVACKPPKTQTFGLVCPTGTEVRTRFDNDIEAKWCYDKLNKRNDGMMVIFGPRKDGVLHGQYRDGFRSGTWRYHDTGSNMEFNFNFDKGRDVETASIHLFGGSKVLLDSQSKVECLLVFQGSSPEGQYQCQCVTEESAPNKASTKTYHPGNNCNHLLPWYAGFTEG